MKVLYTVFIFAALICFQGCVSVPEMTSDYDIVLGEEYQAPIFKLSESHPRRILLLPIYSQIDEMHGKMFFNEFMSQNLGLNIVTSPSLSMRSVMPQKAELKDLAKKMDCDTVLMIQLRQPSAYPPLKIVLDVVLENVANDITLWKGKADYDTSNKLVANSARRYTQKFLNKKDMPDRSLSILQDNPSFTAFAAFHLARTLDQLGSYSAAIVPKEVQKPQKEEIKDY